MPVIIYKQKLKYKDIEENISISFDCRYSEEGGLKLKNFVPDYFDSGDFRIRIGLAMEKFNEYILREYMMKNRGIYCLAIVNYLIDEIPGIYYVKFEAEHDETIYYADEING